MSLTLKVPTHLDGRNPIVGRYTARELVPVVAGVFGAAGVLGQPHLLPPARVGEALAVALLGSAAGLVRPGGRSLVTWGRLAATHRLGERASTWTPPSASVSPASAGTVPGALRPPHLASAMGVSTPAPGPPPSAPARPSGGAPRPARRPATPAHPFVPVEIAADTLLFADGRRCAVLECSGVSVAGLDVEQQRALHAAYHAFLLGLAFPVQVLVCADPVDLGLYAARRTAHLSGRPLAVRRLGSADAAFMRRALSQAGALDQRVYVVIPDTAAPAPSLEGAAPPGPPPVPSSSSDHRAGAGPAGWAGRPRDGPAAGRAVRGHSRGAGPGRRPCLAPRHPRLAAGLLSPPVPPHGTPATVRSRARRPRDRRAGALRPGDSRCG